MFCGSSSGRGVRYLQAAQELGKIIVRENLELVYGGGNVGIMGEIANTVLKYNGHVTGIIPRNLVIRESALREVTELVIVDSMHERKMKMSELSDGYIAMPGGIGTLEEFFEVWTWAQLGIHSKPIGLLNVENYFEKLKDFINHMIENEFVKNENLDMIITDNNPEELIEKMKKFIPVKVKKWIEREDI